MIDFYIGDYMEIVGLITEYNPFHNGHIYHIEKCRSLYPDSLLILVLNGYFLERGEISVLSKEDKTKLALEYGIDLVLELPVIYGTQSADSFAKAALFILNKFQVTTLVFGSETNDINKLTKIAQKQIDEKITLSNSFESYPKRLQTSLKISKLNPNDLLGISYIKTILENKYPITPVSILRTSSYHDLTSNEKVISASNIREKHKKQQNITNYLPEKAITNWQSIDEEKLFALIKYRILTDAHLDEYIDVTEGLDYKMRNEIEKTSSLQELLESLKSKRYTYNRLRRMLIHVLLGHQKKQNEMPITYIRVLGFNPKGKKYLQENRDKFSSITKVKKDSLQYQEERKSALIYDYITSSTSSLFDQKNMPIIYKDTVDKESNQK